MTPGHDGSIAKNCSKSILFRGLDLLHVLELILHDTTVTTMLNYPRSRPRTAAKRLQRLGSAARFPGGPERHYCHHLWRRYPRRRPIHRQEWQQTYRKRLGSAACSSADLVRHYCHHASATPGHHRSIAKDCSESSVTGVNCNSVYTSILQPGTLDRCRCIQDASG